MEILDLTKAASKLAAALGKPCMYISIGSDDAFFDEIIKAAPYLAADENMQVLADGEAIIVFDTVAEMEDAYARTVGDDGPTEKNPYNGHARVYALTIGPDGEMLNENT